jgi:hypothetical protein
MCWHVEIMHGILVMTCNVKNCSIVIGCILFMLYKMMLVANPKHKCGHTLRLGLLQLIPDCLKVHSYLWLSTVVILTLLTYLIWMRSTRAAMLQFIAVLFRASERMTHQQTFSWKRRLMWKLRLVVLERIWMNSECEWGCCGGEGLE